MNNKYEDILKALLEFYGNKEDDVLYLEKEKKHVLYEVWAGASCTGKVLF